MKLVENFSTPQEAYIARGMLDSHGIEAVVNDETSASVYPSLQFTNSNIGLYVPDEDYDRAKDLLASHDD